MIYRRHLKSCPYHGSGSKGRRYWCKDCPIWMDFWKNGIRVHKSMNLTDTGLLEELWIRRSEKIPDTGFSHQGKVEAKSIALGEAWKKFLGQARARKLSRTSIYKYDLLRRRMEDFAKRNGLFLFRDLNTDVLELFQNEFIGSDVTCSKALERLKAFCRAAFLRKWIDENPALTLRGPKPKPRPTLPFTDDEMTRILAAIEKYRDKSRKTGQANALRL